MKKKQAILLLTLSTLVIISIFFSVYFTRVFAKQEAIKQAEIAKEERLAQAKKVKPKKTYLEEMNEKIQTKQFKNRMDIPLVIQTEEPWRDKFYGDEEGEPLQNTLAINGCAIVSLSMVASFLDDKEQTPFDILDWSENRYFNKDSGTAWHIYQDFAAAKGYEYQDLGDNVALAKEHLQEKHPVVVSVKPGYFTEVGHIMVLSGYNEADDTFWVNNPSDSKIKKHGLKAFSEEDITKEALRYWAIYK